MSHSLQSYDPLALLYEPGVHFVQPVEPVKPANVPMGQAMQDEFSLAKL